MPVAFWFPSTASCESFYFRAPARLLKGTALASASPRAYQSGHAAASRVPRGEAPGCPMPPAHRRLLALKCGMGVSALRSWAFDATRP
mmetsp:Transcript_77494/g.214249  ORF Transcript_77494/g.214249 Transcript_77494/m.214249 type:complete len:88 (+) Transcript_77494:3-266(+)